MGRVTLTLTTSGTGAGTIQANSSGPFYYGDVVKIWANASAGSTFTGFTGSLLGTSTPQDLIFDGNESVNAAFTLNGPYTLTLTTSGTGAGTIQANSSGPFYYGDVVKIWANASAGSTFTGFTGSLLGTSTPQDLIFDGNESVNAAFTLNANQPPTITSYPMYLMPVYGLIQVFDLYQSCNVTDNVSVGDVRINITGPVGFTPINNSMTNISSHHYYYEDDNVSVSGTYEFYIWAVDTLGSSVRSNTYYMLVFENYLSNVYVNANNLVGPWNGTAGFPLRFINDALAVIAQNGTIFVHNGVYLDTTISITKSMNFIGENQYMTILDEAEFLIVSILKK